jgi:hypothetical protein
VVEGLARQFGADELAAKAAAAAVASGRFRVVPRPTLLALLARST